MRQKIIFLIIIVMGAFAGVGIGWNSPTPTSREFLITARRYAYDPPLIRVNRGDTLRVKLVSRDVVHGFYLEGYDIDARITPNRKTFQFRHPSEGDSWQEVDSFQVVTDRIGKFRYRCSQTCGTLHPFMQGELIVAPNLTYYGGLGSVIGLFLGIIWLFMQRGKIEADSKT